GGFSGACSPDKGRCLANSDVKADIADRPVFLCPFILERHIIKFDKALQFFVSILDFIVFFFGFSHDGAHALCSCNRRKDGIKLVSQVIERTRELACIFRENDNDADGYVAVQSQKSAGSCHNREAAVVQKVHDFRDKPGIRPSPESGSLEALTFYQK